jgi:hypothetical protein
MIFSGNPNCKTIDAESRLCFATFEMFDTYCAALPTV